MNRDGLKYIDSNYVEIYRYSELRNREKFISTNNIRII